MAKITTEKLDHLTDNEIREFFSSDDLTQYNVSPIKEFIQSSVGVYEMHSRIARVNRILGVIVVHRFVNRISK